MFEIVFVYLLLTWAQVCSVILQASKCCKPFERNVC